MLASDEALIHPALAASLSHGRCSSAHSITTQAYSCPVLSSTASVALEKEALSAAPCPRIELLPTLSCSDCPLVAHAAAYLGEHVMQHLVAAIFPDRPPLCDAKRAYLLRYGAGTVPDGGRTHRIHVDDCDVTLAICLGNTAGERSFEGADLLYIEPPHDGSQRPRTPDPVADPSVVVVRHEHTPGVGVLHHGDAYHVVEPLLSGVRCTLVIQAMFRDGRAWKETFLHRLAPTGRSPPPMAQPALIIDDGHHDASRAPPLGQARPIHAVAPAAAQIFTVAELAKWADMTPASALSASTLVSEPLEPLARLMLEEGGRLQLLTRLKSLGVAKLADRQALANALARSVREGRVRSPGGERLPMDFEAAAARLPAAARTVLLEGPQRGDGARSKAEQAAALIASLREAAQHRGRSSTSSASCGAAISATAAASALAAAPTDDACHADAAEVKRFDAEDGEVVSRRADLLTVPGALAPAACATLRAAVDARRSVAKDSVDRGAEHQLNLSLTELENLIGAEALRTLLDLPARLQAQRCAQMGSSEQPCEQPCAPPPLYRTEVFIRRYTREERPFIQFHCDSAAVTVNVALASDAEHTGGRLVCVVDDELEELARGQGEATVHPSNLLHAVTAMQSGVRYSAILFFHHDEQVADGSDSKKNSRTVPWRARGQVTSCVGFLN